ncbi:MAG: 7-carboxy-7-deazaguanine synthase QueE [Ignavibacteriae bacterium]|nr:7-carboxy-7-deazaguanine synthase QueE [Ignavibacteriota bacterium]
MKISELFYSIQGEGKRTGYPSFFIRTNLCNLRCKFKSGNLCDTPYTSWDFENPSNLGDLSIFEIIKEYKKHYPADIVITGGEPTIQGKELISLCHEIKQLDKNIFITLETNGTFFDEYALNVDIASISPKLKTSVPFKTEFEKGHEKNRINYKSLKSYQELHEIGNLDIQWKFVVTGRDDMEEIQNLQKQIGFDNEDVFLMPEGISENNLSEKRLMVVELCKEYHYNYTDRLHITLWGNKRGV